MKNCEYCDYCKTVETDGRDAEAGMALCSFTNLLFFTGPDKAQKEYLCRNISYQEYLDTRDNRPVPSKLNREDWKLLYRSRHPVAERERARSAV
jgi:hypothetical protein